MSRRSSSKSSRGNGTYRVSENSVGAAIAAKNPEMARKMANDATKANTPEARSRGGPRIMPGDLTPARKLRTKKTNSSNSSYSKPKKKKSKVSQRDLRPKNGPLKITRTIVSPDTPKQTKVGSTKQSARPSSNILQNAFRAMERSDGLGRYECMPDQGAIDQLNALGQQYRAYLASQAGQSDDFFLNIGFDFGTSCSKIIVSAPYFAGEPSFALAVPGFFQMDDHPHLWKGILSLEKSSERLSLLPLSDSQQISDLKTTLMGTPHRVLCKSKGAQMTSEYCCAAFIGLLLRLTKGWVWQNFSQFFGQDPAIFKIRWEANFGLPATTIEDSELKSKFAGVFRAAWQMSESSADLDGNSLARFFADAEAKRTELDFFIDIRPEVAAQAIGLIRANLADFGTYALVDVGASTLDVCVFNYLDGGDADKQALFVADVTLLGAQSPIWFDLLKQKGVVDADENQLRREIRQAMAGPVILTKTRKNRRATVWKEVLPVIFAGGGRQSAIHKDAFVDFESDWVRLTETKGIKLVEPSVPTGLRAMCETSEYHRLSVAWGLSITKDDFGDVVLPVEIPPDRKKFLDLSNNYVSKDDV